MSVSPCPECRPLHISGSRQYLWGRARGWGSSLPWPCPGGDRGQARCSSRPPGWGGRPRSPSLLHCLPSPPARQSEGHSSSSQCELPRCCAWPAPRSGSELESCDKSLCRPIFTVCPICQCSSVRTPDTRSWALNVSEWTFFPSTNHLTSISMLWGTMTSERTALQWKTISDWRLLVVWVTTAADIFTVTKMAKTGVSCVGHDGKHGNGDDDVLYSKEKLIIWQAKWVQKSQKKR